MEPKEILAWHFLRVDKKLGYGDNRLVSLDDLIAVDPDKLDLCHFGLHGSVKILDAISFIGWENAIVCRVKLSGRIIEGVDKCVASERTVISWYAADRILHEFACRVAEDVLLVFEKNYPNCTGLRNAIEAKRLWLEGNINDAGLAAAYDAAAAHDAVRSAVRAVAHGTARIAAMSVAWAATRAAARSGVGAAARSAARSAAINKYNGWLEEMVLGNTLRGSTELIPFYNDLGRWL